MSLLGHINARLTNDALLFYIHIIIPDIIYRR